MQVVSEGMKAAFPMGDCMWFCDTEDPAAIRELKSYGHSARKAQKHIIAGVQLVNAMIASGRVFISAACENLILEGQAYCYSDKDAKEVPIKEFDHAMDALRYLCMGIKKMGYMAVFDGLDD